MTRWKGLKIQKFRVNTTGLLFDRIESQFKNVSLPKGYKEQDSVHRSHYFNRYRPSFYLPIDYKMLIISNEEHRLENPEPEPEPLEPRLKNLGA
jgi:hypothetical protein